MAPSADNPGSVVVVGTQSTLLMSENRSRGKTYAHNRSTVPVGVRFASFGASAGAVAFYLEAGEKWEFDGSDWQGPLCAYCEGAGPATVTVGEV